MHIYFDNLLFILYIILLQSYMISEIIVDGIIKQIIHKGRALIKEH